VAHDFAGIATLTVARMSGAPTHSCRSRCDQRAPRHPGSTRWSKAISCARSQWAMSHLRSAFAKLYISISIYIDLW